MRVQVEDRLKFLASGEATAKNNDVMKEVLDELKSDNLYVNTDGSDTADTNLKKRKATTDLDDEAEDEEEKPKKKKKKKKSKKDKKKKKKKKKTSDE